MINQNTFPGPEMKSQVNVSTECVNPSLRIAFQYSAAQTEALHYRMRMQEIASSHANAARRKIIAATAG